MSAPRIKVHSDSYDTYFICTECGRLGQSHPESPDWTLADAADAGRRHLFEQHYQQVAPLVQTIVSNTRCTCGDLPRPSYPYFSPCPVHSYVVNTTNQLAYPRQCGVPIAACGADTCHCVPVDPDAAKVAQNAAQQFGDDFPCCTNPMQRTHNESREGC